MCKSEFLDSSEKSQNLAELELHSPMVTVWELWEALTTATLLR